jgi:hypothetical protein
MINMSKKKGLGRDVSTSLESMDALLSALRDFTGMPLKKGLDSNKVADDKLLKMVNDSVEQAVKLHNMVHDLARSVKGLKTNVSSRFASQVVQRFLNDQDQ